MLRHLLILLLFLSMIASAQLSIKNTVSRNKDSLIFYTDIENKLTLYFGDSARKIPYHKKITIKPGKYEVTAQQYKGNITKANLKFMYQGKIQLVLNIGGRDSIVNGYVRVPKPYAGFSGQCDTVMMSQQRLLSYNGLPLYYKDKSFAGRFLVTSFRIVVVTPMNDFYSLQVEGPYFSKEAKEILNKARSRSKVYFEDIKARTEDGRICNAAPLLVKVYDSGAR